MIVFPERDQEVVSTHAYLSTACWHAQQNDFDGADDDELHGFCQKDLREQGRYGHLFACTWCAAPCVCDCHKEADHV